LTAQHELACSLRDPDGEFVLPKSGVTLAHQGAPFHLEGERLHANVVLTFAPVVLHREGVHEVQVELDGELVGQFPLPVAVL
jgi:uncharacterized protein DUF6941